MFSWLGGDSSKKKQQQVNYNFQISFATGRRHFTRFSATRFQTFVVLSDLLWLLDHPCISFARFIVVLLMIKSCVIDNTYYNCIFSGD